MNELSLLFIFFIVHRYYGMILASAKFPSRTKYEKKLFLRTLVDSHNVLLRLLSILVMKKNHVQFRLIGNTDEYQKPTKLFIGISWLKFYQKFPLKTQNYTENSSRKIQK